MFHSLSLTFTYWCLCTARRIRKSANAGVPQGFLLHSDHVLPIACLVTTFFFWCVTDAQLTLVPTCLLMCASLTKNTDSTIHITLTHFQTTNRVISPYDLTAATNHDSKSIHIASIYHTVLSHSYRYLMNRTRNRGRARGPVGFDAPINMGSAKCEIEWNSIFQGKYLTDY